jgi:hypothetical protein
MHDIQLEQVYGCLQKSVSAEGFFASMSKSLYLQTLDSDRSLLSKIYNDLLLICDIDRYSDAINKQRLAKETQKRVDDFFQRGLEKLNNNTWGVFERPQNVFTISTPTRSYDLPKHLIDGDLCSIYKGSCSDGDGLEAQVVFKMIEDEEKNSFLEREVEALRLLHSSITPYNKHLPVLLETVDVEGMNKASILRYFDGFDLSTIRKQYPKGLDQHHVVWIMLRVLRCLGFTHSKGVIHGNIQPAHIMVRPHDHNVILIDWCYSIIRPRDTGHQFRVFSEIYSGPEVQKKKDPLPSADIYSLGKSMIYLLGGDAQNNTLPDHVDERLQRLLLFCTLPSALGRPQNAWELHDRLQNIRSQIFGEHKFEIFTMST